MHLQSFTAKVFLVSAVLTLAGCAYRLPPIAPPSHQLVRIDANTPEQYSVQVNTGTVSEYGVPHDGRIKVEIPSYRPSCGVYLFDAIKVRGYDDPLKSWTVFGHTQRKNYPQAIVAGDTEISDG